MDLGTPPLKSNESMPWNSRSLARGLDILLSSSGKALAIRNAKSVDQINKRQDPSKPLSSSGEAPVSDEAEDSPGLRARSRVPLAEVCRVRSSERILQSSSLSRCCLVRSGSCTGEGTGGQDLGSSSEGLLYLAPHALTCTGMIAANAEGKQPTELANTIADTLFRR